MPHDEHDHTEPLLCARDGVEVAGDQPRCLHPSGYCEYRATCPVVEAERRRRKQEDLQDMADSRQPSGDLE